MGRPLSAWKLAIAAVFAPLLSMVIFQPKPGSLSAPPLIDELCRERPLPGFES